MELTECMKLAIEEAKISLREANNGFGAVIVKDGNIVSQAHDRECTEGDPTSHAEMNAIKAAAHKLGRNLGGCILVSTHEPCPMCASAIVWSGITEIAYGYSIEEALQQGRKRIDLSCSELFRRAGVNVKVHEGILKEECAVLYRADVRAEIEKLRDIDDKRLDELNADSTNRRIKWFKENRDKFTFLGGDAVAAGYRLLLERFGITETQAPVIEKSAQEIVFHSKNFCPTLEACKILGLDTRVICRGLNERSTDALIKLVDRRLVFSRNYQKLRPYTECCEEKITIT